MPVRRGSNGKFAANGGRKKKKLTSAQRRHAMLIKQVAKRKAIRAGKASSDKTVRVFQKGIKTSKISDARRRGDVLATPSTTKTIKGKVATVPKGKPSKGTKADKRLKANKKKK